VVVTEWEIYRTERLKLPSEIKRIIIGGVHAVTFTSGSTVRNFLSNFSKSETPRIFKNTIALSIGPITTKELRAHRVPHVRQARQAVVESMVDTLIKGMK
jgi:uroporphyrinogen III methyltransferase/synthase